MCAAFRFGPKYEPVPLGKSDRKRPELFEDDMYAGKLYDAKTEEARLSTYFDSVAEFFISCTDVELETQGGLRLAAHKAILAQYSGERLLYRLDASLWQAISPLD